MEEEEEEGVPCKGDNACSLNDENKLSPDLRSGGR